MSNKLLLFSVVRACNPVARITYTVLVGTLSHAQSKRACNFIVLLTYYEATRFTGVTSSGL